ncbi:MAG: glycosyltransferase family 4 protein [Bacteroidetes bacterium]|nr:glycosyltransferase family 4 protein [Bacteroidota bacterium]MBS1649254.1 glycosyltransferase family 4 protein [Bacteroidota bacterium]
MKIIISNPSKQYTHQTVKALLNAKHEVIFYTSMWYKQNNFLWKLLSVNKKLKNELLKKTDTSIPSEIIRTNTLGTLYKFFGRFIFKDIELWSLIEDRIHDNYVSKQLKKQTADVFIGYEKSCLKSFAVAKQLGVITILDLAQVHVNFIVSLREQFPFFKTISGKKKTFDKITIIKQKEYNKADCILTLSTFAKQTLLTNGIPESKIKVASLGFNTNLFLSKTNYLNNKKLRLIFIGIITFRKGIADLIEVMKQLENENIELVVIGPRGDASQLLNNQSNYSNIKYIEYLHHADMVKELQQADVFVLPSYLDSWAAVVIEAMACGLPVIISNNTGAKDAVDDSCGFVIETGNILELKKYINYFYNNKNAANAMGKNAAIKAQAYTWSHYNNELLQAINSCLINYTANNKNHV